MNPQTIAEGKRILGILDDLREDLRILSVLPPTFTSIPPKDMNHLLSSFNDEEGANEVHQQLQEHYELERQLESVASTSPTEIADLHFSSRALVDTLRSAGYPNHYTPAFAPTANIDNFESIIQTFRGVLAERFTQTVDDDAHKFSILHDTVNRERNASADVQALMRELQIERDSKRVEVEKRNIAIKRLTEEKKGVDEGAKEDKASAEKVAAESEQREAQRFQQEYADLEQQVIDLEKELGGVEDKCEVHERELRQMRNKKEGLVNQTIQSYDQEMTQFTAALAALQEEIDRDNEEMTTVTAELTVHNEEAEKHASELALEEDRRTHTVMIESKMNAHAQVIQGFYRAFACRMHMAQKGKKKGKKK